MDAEKEVIHANRVVGLPSQDQSAVMRADERDRAGGRKGHIIAVVVADAVEMLDPHRTVGVLTHEGHVPTAVTLQGRAGPRHVKETLEHDARHKAVIRIGGKGSNDDLIGRIQGDHLVQHPPSCVGGRGRFDPRFVVQRNG